MGSLRRAYRCTCVSIGNFFQSNQQKIHRKWQLNRFYEENCTNSKVHKWRVLIKVYFWTLIVSYTPMVLSTGEGLLNLFLYQICAKSLFPLKHTHMYWLVSIDCTLYIGISFKSLHKRNISLKLKIASIHTLQTWIQWWNLRILFFWKCKG